MAIACPCMAASLFAKRHRIRQSSCQTGVDDRHSRGGVWFGLPEQHGWPVVTDSAFPVGQPHSDRILAGLALRALSVLLFSVLGAMVKIAGQRGANLAEILFFRQTFALPLVLAWIATGPGLRSIATRRIGAHVSRAALGLVGMATSFTAVLLLPLAEATTLQFMVPIFATIMGALLLREPTGWHRWGAVLLGFAGVLIIARPGSGHFPLLGSALGLTSALSVAVVMILLRTIGRTESASTTTFWFSALSVVPLGLVYLFKFQDHDPFTWALLVGIGLVGGAGQLAMTASFRVAPVSAVVSMDYSALIWGTLFGWLLFAAIPGPTTWIGAAIIIASGLYIAHREHRRRGLVSTAVRPLRTSRVAVSDLAATHSRTDKDEEKTACRTQR
jgi:drug/metabolite transporter (DMT)-like permease